MPRLRPAQVALPVLVWMFVASMIVPGQMTLVIGPLSITPQRVVLLLALIPIIMGIWRYARLWAQDFLVVAAGLWGFAAALMHLPMAAGLERGGAFFLECTVAYLLPVALITSLQQIRRFVRIMWVVVLILGALAFVEATTHRHHLAEISARLLGLPVPEPADVRLGLLRARVTFNHQILYGVFCASLTAFFWLESTTASTRLRRMVVVGAATAMSMSSAPMLMLALQSALLGIEAVTRRVADRLVLIGGAIVVTGASVHLLVGGGIAGFVTRYLSLNPWTASYRQLVWTHVSDDVWASPWIGTGGTWTRLSWMGDSVDNFYYFKALSYGVPVVALLIGAVLIVVWSLLRSGVGQDLAGRMRFAWLVAIFAIAFGGLTVDYHGRILPFVMMIAGLGSALMRISAGNRAR